MSCFKRKYEKYLEKLNDKEIKFIGNLKYSIEIEGNIFFNKNLSKLKIIITGAASTFS